MSNFVVVLIITAAFIDFNDAVPQPEPAPAVLSFLTISYYNECDGKDAANYTLVHGSEGGCDIGTRKGTYTYLVQSQAKHQSAVNSLTVLATSEYPAGAYRQVERIYHVSGGPLQGRYLYTKTIILENAYLKKCSSVLGYSYVTSKSAVLLINDNLDMNVLISPTGGYEVFKKGCTTICKGSRYVV